MTGQRPRPPGALGSPGTGDAPRAVPVCTGRRTHPAVPLVRAERGAAWLPARHRNWTSPLASHDEWRCPSCGRTWRLGARRAALLAAALDGIGAPQVDFSFLA